MVRTSFRSEQGKLLRTILYGAKRVTANNKETFAFIMFLLVFAIAAVWYLWEYAPAERSKYKLLLESILIITSVVPPELPIQLSLAVNNSLLSLHKLAIFCTEPFRIPFAGKVDVCCFDKTGTLTTDTLVVDGVTSVETGEIQASIKPDAQIVLASCHALVLGNDPEKEGQTTLIGDPLEKVCINSTDWQLIKSDLIKPNPLVKHQKSEVLDAIKSLRILHRHHFSSLLKRMSVISCFESGPKTVRHLVTVKGAAEVLGSMLLDQHKPENYDQQHKRLARKGIRVLALAYKLLPDNVKNPKKISREEVESDLIFAGFVCVNTPLKKDSIQALKNLRESSHHLVMITGDHALTATYVALKTNIIRSAKEKIMVVDLNKDSELGKYSLMQICYQNDSESQEYASSIEDLIRKVQVYNSVVMTGPALESVEKYCKSQKNDHYLKVLIPMVCVFARTSPQQKENIINCFKDLNFTTLMCGDGTNDVGALKHAHVGIGLLPHAEKKKKKKTPAEIEAEKQKQLMEAERMKNMTPLQLRQKKMDDIGLGFF